MPERAWDHLHVGLQEWAVICAGLADGSVDAIVRKGGIHEPRGGTFTIQQPRFLLLPTWLHQDPDRLLPAWRQRFADLPPAPDPERITISLWAAVAATWKVEDPARLEALTTILPWTEAELRRRYRYRNQPWLAVVALRVYRLPTPVEIPFLASYRGCRSWIPLEEPVTITDSTPVHDSATWAARLATLERVAGPGEPAR